MKLPFDFGLKLFFRLLLPGFFLTLGFLPAVFTLLDEVGWSARYEAGFVVSVILSGWLTLVLDMPVYMLFEGRRFWPAFLWNFFFERERRRLKRIEREMNHFQYVDRKKYLEASVEVRKFPMNDAGQYEAMFPTRLGNLITAFERYPTTRYGTDAVFYWPRIWLKLDKDHREEIDNQQAMADSTVYTSFALTVAGLVWGFYSLLSAFGATFIRHLPRPAFSWLLSLAFLLLGYAVYRASLHINAQFGELFKSVFDNQVTKIESEVVDVKGVLERVKELTGDEELEKKSRNEKLKVVWRYLHNFRVKCPYCGNVLPPSEVGDHLRAQHQKERPLLKEVEPPRVVRGS